MRDSEFVASILAGDPEGLAAVYDKYAGDLYGYCQSLLQDQHDAADAVQDTFVIAASKLAGLRDPERLRAWLFAVARNECLHRLKSRRAAASLSEAPEPADDSVDIAVVAERAETVALIRAAVGGLNDGERDIINQLWHGLEVAEVAAVLGVSRNHAHTLFSRARNQLEASVGVLLVGRAGRRDCATLDSLLGDWDGRLTALLRKRVGRHIDRCQVCSDRRRKELTPALLYGVTPGALLAMAGLRGGTALTAAAQACRAAVRGARSGAAASRRSRLARGGIPGGRGAKHEFVRDRRFSKAGALRPPRRLAAAARAPRRRRRDGGHGGGRHGAGRRAAPAADAGLARRRAAGRRAWVWRGVGVGAGQCDRRRPADGADRGGRHGGRRAWKARRHRVRAGFSGLDDRAGADRAGGRVPDSAGRRVDRAGPRAGRSGVGRAQRADGSANSGRVRERIVAIRRDAGGVADDGPAQPACSADR